MMRKTRREALSTGLPSRPFPTGATIRSTVAYNFFKHAVAGWYMDDPDGGDLARRPAERRPKFGHSLGKFFGDKRTRSRYNPAQHDGPGRSAAAEFQSDAADH